MSYLKEKGHQCILLLYVQPGASKNEIVGPHGEPSRLKVKVKAPPVDGEANLEAISFIAKTLGIPKSRVELVRGQTSRQKDLLIDLPLKEVVGVLEKEK